MSSLSRFSTLILFGLFLQVSPASSQWAIELAGTREVQYGTFVAPCGCTFQPSAGWGIDGDLRYDFAVTPPFTFGAAAGVHFMNYTSYEEPDKVDSSDLARIGMTYLTLEPSIRWTVANSPFSLRLGANIGFLVGNSYHHETHPIPDPEEDVDSSMGDLRTLRIAARLSAGYAIPVGHLVLVPTIGVELPLNAIRDENASDWRVVSYLAGIGIRFRP